MHTSLRLGLDHPPVKLILVPKRCFLAETFETFFLGLVVPSTEDVVFLLFEETEFGSGERLSSFFVVAAMHRV
jgi:hypothetical protein